VGGFFGYSRGNYDVDSRRSSMDIDNYHLGLYAAARQDAFSCVAHWVTPGIKLTPNVRLISAATRIA
jgi:outer membrane autotransporter protein